MDADFRILDIRQVCRAISLIDELAEAVVEAAFAIFDAGLEQFVAEAERAEFAHGMRQQRDADAEFLDLRRTLIDAAGDAALLEVEGKRQSTDAAADNRYIHSAPPAPLPYSGLTSTLRNLIAPAPCCNTIGPSSNMPLRSFAVVWPLRTTVMSRPLTVTS